MDHRRWRCLRCYRVLGRSPWRKEDPAQLVRQGRVRIVLEVPQQEDLDQDRGQDAHRFRRGSGQALIGHCVPEMLRPELSLLLFTGITARKSRYVLSRERATR